MERKWLKMARKKAGLSQKNMANACKMSDSYYSCIERGIRQKRMELEVASNIASALGTTLDHVREQERIWRQEA